MPDSSKEPIDVANNSLVSVIGGNSEDKVGEGGSITIPEESPSSDFICEDINSNQCAITSYNGTSQSLVIPSYIDSKEVVEIAQNAFLNKGLTSVVLPATVSKIGNYAFSGNSLTSINLLNVEEVGTEAFANNDLVSVNTGKISDISAGAFMNNSIISLTINEGVTAIRASAFANNSIESLSLPNGLQTIEREAFYNNKIKTLYVNASLSTLQTNAFGFQSITSGIVFMDGDYNRFDANWNNYFDSKLKKEARTEFRYNKLSDTTCSLTAYTGSLTDIAIPSEIDGLTVVEIADEALANRRLTSVVIPNTIQRIGSSAFENNNLSLIIIPASVRTIDDYAFAGNKMNAIEIRGNLNTLGVSAFADQEIINGTVILTDNTVDNFGLLDETNWQKYFDKKLQKGR